MKEQGQVVMVAWHKTILKHCIYIIKGELQVIVHMKTDIFFQGRRHDCYFPHILCHANFQALNMLVTDNE